MTDLVKEMNLKTIAAAAENVQAHVEKIKSEGLNEKTAESYIAPGAAKLMTPIVGLAIKNKVPGDEILKAIHEGSEKGRTNKSSG